MAHNLRYLRDPALGDAVGDWRDKAESMDPGIRVSGVLYSVAELRDERNQTAVEARDFPTVRRNRPWKAERAWRAGLTTDSQPKPEWQSRDGDHLSVRTPIQRAGALELPLSDREKEVVACIARDMTEKQAGAALGISRKTVEFHIARIKVKLGVTGVAGITRWALKAGLVE